MPYYRVTWGGYIEGEYESEEAARAALIDFIDDEDIDQYGRDWIQLIEVERLDEESDDGEH